MKVTGNINENQGELRSIRENRGISEIIRETKNPLLSLIVPDSPS